MEDIEKGMVIMVIMVIMAIMEMTDMVKEEIMVITETMERKEIMDMARWLQGRCTWLRRIYWKRS